MSLSRPSLHYSGEERLLKEPEVANNIKKYDFPDTIGLVSNEHTETVTICTKYANVQTKVLAHTRGYGQKYHHNSKVICK